MIYNVFYIILKKWELISFSHVKKTLFWKFCKKSQNLHFGFVFVQNLYQTDKWYVSYSTEIPVAFSCHLYFIAILQFCEKLCRKKVKNDVFDRVIWFRHTWSCLLLALFVTCHANFHAVNMKRVSLARTTDHTKTNL